MSPELNRRYRVLATDVDAYPLPTPEAVRRLAERRLRTRGATGALAVAVLAGGTVAGTQWGVTAGPPSQPPRPVPPPATSVPPTSVPPTSVPPTSVPPTAGATPTASADDTSAPARTTPPATGAPSASAPARLPTSIPDRAFFTPLAGTAVQPPEFVDGPVLPELCGRTPAAPELSRTRSLIFWLDPQTPQEYVPDGSYLHTVSVHGPGLADDWLVNLRRAVRECPLVEIAPGLVSLQRLLPDGAYGDESVLFEMRTRTFDEDPAGTGLLRLVRAIRVGDVVTVLWERGWEYTSTDRIRFDFDSRRAVRAVEAWLA
ncbi:hypothetical protein GA0070616_1665 [Micromonospora nigra]|uniref:Uncharacterized protein n=1 Tax=Micromonospora nigra TaxID=145857 RepID=A0A1C6RPH2_9ACTN|nr:hypothetical protein [Micromonospora nigra]SCL19103.1 hypothetical protein GA0070616_1665 [Micromonospora nigra]